MSITFINVEKRINDTLVFPSFSLTVGAGNVIAIQSSVNVREQLVNLLLGKTPLSNGKIKIGNDDISDSHHKVGFLFLNSGLYERLTIEENMKFFKRIYNSNESIDNIMAAVHLDSRRKIKIKNLLHSEKRRFQFACLLIKNPDVFILEEPDQNIDLESKRIYLSILQKFRKEGKGVVILTGNLENAVTAADEVYRLDEKGFHPIQIQENSADDSKNVEVIQPVRFEKIPTKVNERIVLFNPPEIDYIESIEGQSYLHIKEESFPCVFTLSELEERLLPYGFFRCHRSYIVNLQKVREVITWTRNSFSLILNDEKTVIPLSKTKMTDLKEMLGLK